MNLLAIAWLALGLSWAVVFGSRAALVAGERNRRREWWFLFGAVLGPGAVVILDAAPPGVCANCLSPVVGWSTTCALCGQDVRANPMIDLMLGSEQVQPRPVGAPIAVTSPAAAPTRAAVTAASANEVPPYAGPLTRQRTDAAPTVAATARLLDDPRPAAEPGAAPQAPAKLQPATEPATERRPTYVAPPAAKPAAARRTPAPPPAADAAAVANAATTPRPGPRGGEPQVDLDMRRPMRLASCIFVEGTMALVQGMWYQLTSEGSALSIWGPPGSLPDASVLSWPLTEIEVKTRGDRLVVTSASGSDKDLRLVFKSTLDWTPLGLKREVDARRYAEGSGPGNP